MNVLIFVMFFVKFFEYMLLVLKLLNLFVKFNGVREFVGNLSGFLIF